VIRNPRGCGTFIAYDIGKTEDERNTFIGGLKKLGVYTMGCGTNSIRNRTCLFFKQKHAD